ncbi:type IV secretory system conjugative DNA transfer family protein [Candidatus Parcubacteria bacterium]|nr:type IV secretory system conjugative DNA transfer family protein [Candidatus Parcubacteria bacterium]
MANNDIFLNSLIVFIFLFLSALLVLFAAKIIIRKVISKNEHFDHIIYLIRLPKDKPGNQEREDSVQQLREEIAKGETIFSSIGGLRAQRGFWAWFKGRSDHFSFEIAASKKKIVFYAVAPRKLGRYIEQQIHAHYPEAVIEEVDDYNIFTAKSHVVAGFLKASRSFIFPLKTYNKMEADPMNSIINVMSKLEVDEGLSIQYLVRSAKPAWHAGAAKIAACIHKGETMKEALKSFNKNPFFVFLSEAIKAAKTESPEEKQKKISQQPPRLTAMEEEMLKGIEEKNSKAGLDVNLRVIVSAKNAGQARLYLDNLSSAYSQYNYYEYGNSFGNKIKIKKQKKLISDYIYRRFDDRIGFLLNTEELASLYHLPLKTSETPNILWLTARHAAAPVNIPGEGLLLGRNIYRGEVSDVRVKRADRRRHTYVVGKSGTGKSKLIAGMAIQDILNGEGICLLDPHGDLVADVLNRIPPERAEDVILFAPADTERPLAFNLLEYDPKYPEQKTFVINEMIKIFDKLYDLKATGGPIFEQYVRNAMLLIMSDPASGSTLMEIPKVLADADFRKMKLKKCSDPTVVDFWKKEAEKAGGDAALANVVPYVTSKLTQFISNDTMRPIIGQQKSSFSIRDVMDKQKILLVDLSKGQVGEMNSYLLGMILVGKILIAALSRTDISEEKRKDFYLYIDEFQNFTTDSICSILSEARKYNLNLIIAHQYLGQLAKNQDTSIKDAVFGNVGTMMVFKIGSEDAEFLSKEFSPVFNQFDLINIEKYTTYVKLLIDNTAGRPFSMATLWPLPGIEREGMAGKIKTLSRLKFGQDRNIIEAEIRKRTVGG